MYAEAIVHERFDEALGLLEKEVAAKPNDVSVLTCRAALNFKLGNIAACQADCLAALKVQADNSDAMYWNAICMFYTGRFEEAKHLFRSLVSSHMHAQSWMNKCAAESPVQRAVSNKITYDWTQTDSSVSVNFAAPNLTKQACKVTIGEREISVTIHQANGNDYLLALDLFDRINKDSSSFQVTPTGLLISLSKVNAVAWKSLEYKETSNPSYPTSSKVKKDWSKIDRMCDAELRAEKDTGEAGLNNFFKEIYGSGDDEARRAMIKSFQTSGGTVLSTNWSEVKKADYEGTDRPSAPAGQQWAK